jgi:drug/metabolite transporter (DMT)-like permease
LQADSARSRATLTGAGAIALWASAAALTAMAGNVPPFALLAASFIIATLAGFAFIALQGKPLSAAFSTSAKAWAVGLYGLFGFHAAYFVALKSAPVATANLINYLWPLLLVVFSGFGAGPRRYGPLTGAAIGFGGVLMLALGNGLTFQSGALLGYAMAAVSAFIWASYSVLLARLPHEPTETITGYCLVTALLALPAHMLFERTHSFAFDVRGLAVLALGLGPMGAAFFLWDHGLKRGDAALLGALSYITPIASTGLLVLAGLTTPTLMLALAALLVATGAFIAARAKW